MSALRVAVVALALVGAGAGAQTPAPNPYPNPPAPGAPRPFSVAPPVERTLPNGMRVVLAQRPGVGLVTAQLLVLSGSETDPPALAGLASMTATLLTKGTRQRTATALASDAETLGGSLDSGAGWNRSAVSITVAPPMLDAALGLVAEVATQPTFAQQELDRARAQALDELKVAYTRPGTLAGWAVERLTFGASPYGHPASGTPGSLQKITRNDLVNLHRALYRPDNAVLVLAGDLDAAAAQRYAQRHFGGWRAAPAARNAAAAGASAPVAPAQAASAAPLSTPLVVINLPQSGQAGVTLAVPAPPSRTDRAVGQVTNAVLGGGYSSRLNQEIRIKRGLSYGASSGLDARRDAGLLRAAVQTKNESAGEVVGLLQTEFERLATTPVPAEDLAARKATVIGGFSRSVETTAGLAAAVSSLVVAGLPTDDLGKRIGALEAVTPADVQRYAATWFAAGNRRMVVAGDAAKFGDAVKALAPAAPVIQVDQLDFENPAGLTR